MRRVCRQNMEVRLFLGNQSYPASGRGQQPRTANRNITWAHSRRTLFLCIILHRLYTSYMYGTQCWSQSIDATDCQRPVRNASLSRSPTRHATLDSDQGPQHQTSTSMRQALWPLHAILQVTNNVPSLLRPRLVSTFIMTCSAFAATPRTSNRQKGLSAFTGGGRTLSMHAVYAVSGRRWYPPASPANRSLEPMHPAKQPGQQPALSQSRLCRNMLTSTSPTTIHVKTYDASALPAIPCRRSSMHRRDGLVSAHVATISTS